MRFVWAREDILGTIDAGRNIGLNGYWGTEDFYDGGPYGYAVFAHGTIDANILANNAGTDPNGGHIGRVAAIGQIDGVIQAADSIAEVRSADQILATISAPNMPSTIDFDTSLATQYPLPPLPASVKQEILDAALVVFNELTSDKAQVAADIADLLADFATAKADEAADIAQLRANVATRVADAIAQAQAALQEDKAAVAAGLNALREWSMRMLHEIRQMAAQDKAKTIETRDRISTERSRSHQKATAGKQRTATELQAAQSSVAAGRTDDLANSDAVRTSRNQGWTEIARRLDSSITIGWHVSKQPDPPPRPVVNRPTTASSVWYDESFWPTGQFEAVRGEKLDGANRAFDLFDAYVSFLPGIGWAYDGYKAYSGKDMFGRELSAVERAFSAFGFGAPLLALGLSGILSHLDDVARHGDELADLGRGADDAVRFVDDLPCTSSCVCFVAGTGVQSNPASGGVWYAAAGIAAAGTLGGYAASERRRKRRQQLHDDCFAGSDGFAEDNEPVDWHNELHERDDMNFDELCDRLFNGQDDFWQRDSDLSSRADAGSYGLKARHTPAQGRASRRQPHSVALGMETIERGSPEGATLMSPIVAARKPATQTANKPPSWRRKLNVTGLFSGLFLALALGAVGYQKEHTSTRPIEDFEPGHKAIVDAPQEAIAADVVRLNGFAAKWNAGDGSLTVEDIDDPLRALTEATPEQIHRVDYRLIILRAMDVWPDGTVDDINVKTLQPSQWIQAHEVRVGGTAPLPLDAEEMGLAEGIRGVVLDILPCPAIETGRGRVVLTTVNHLNRDVVELTLRDTAGHEETLRPTNSHKFYSASRGEWLSAEDLQLGERLNGIGGEVTVASLAHLPGTHRVYNMTVQGEHFYRVARCGVLVHNNGCLELYDFTVDGLQATRIRGGNPERIAVIGRGMNRVDGYADALRNAGKQVNTLELSKAAKEELDLLKAANATPDEVMNSLAYAANRAWVQGLIDDGYTVIDLGGGAGSPFYDMEQFFLFFGR